METINEVVEVVQESALVDTFNQDLIDKLDYVIQCLVSIDTSLKYLLILFLLYIGVILAKAIIWDVVMKHM